MFGRKKIILDNIVTNITRLTTSSQPTNIKEIEKLNLVERIKASTKTAWTLGTGLTAIQIDIPLRCAWYKIPDPSKLNCYIEEVLVNPEILRLSGAWVVGKEGCLSIPGQWFRTLRYQAIVYKNNGFTKTALGFQALVIQHEVDHMNGTLCTSRIYTLKHIGRNDSCPCGSGKKFKKCCIDKGKF